MRTGTIQNISSRDVNTRFGLKPFYVLTIDGSEYDYGWKHPIKQGLPSGAEVEFDSVVKYGKNELTTIRLAGSGGAPASPTPPPPDKPAATPPVPSHKAPPARPFPVPPLHGDRAIIRQNALSHAALLIAAKYSTGTHTLPATLDALGEEVIDLAYKFEDYSTGTREVREMEKTGA